ncbi:MAG: hypothetical protein HOV68_11920 [Streptomycetaceae bacterium]|nr:hypothetical protein [Streptomycetaceae bacterium]
MYLVFALLAPIVMFGLIPGLAWFEERMLGPDFRPKTLADPASAPPPAKPNTAQPTADSAAPADADTADPTDSDPAAAPPPSIPLQPVTPLLGAVRPALKAAPIRHRLRHTVKRGRGLRAA